MTKFDLQKIIEDLVTSMTTQIYLKEIELNYYIEPDVPDLLTGDLVNLRQILSKLTENAIKFTDKGDVLITVSLDSIKEEKVSIRFSIFDTGIGLTEKMQNKLLSFFTMEDSTLNGMNEGIGSSLVICKELVKQIGGNMGLTSREGGGSVFWFTAEMSKKNQENNSDIQKEEISSLNGIESFCVVESPITARIINKYLTVKGCINKKLYDLNEVLSVIEDGSSETYKVLLIDKRIAGKDNRSLIQKLRGKEDSGKIRVIELIPIGYPLNENDSEYCFDTYIKKPIRKQILFETVEKCLKQKQSFESKSLQKDSQEKEYKADFRILVVEDNQINQKIITAILRKIGLLCDVVDRGEDAISAVARKKYDLIFMDCHMPEMDGYETSIQIRNSGIDTPIVAMTADSWEDVVEQCNLSGMNGFLGKPMTISSVSEIIEKWVPDFNLNMVGNNEKVQTRISDGNEIVEIDEKTLLERIGGDKQFLQMLLNVYVNDNGMLMRKLDTAIHSSTIQYIREILHSLKGSSVNICAIRFSTTVSEMYNAAKNSDYDKVINMYHELTAGWIDLKTFIDNYKK